MNMRKTTRLVFTLAAALLLTTGLTGCSAKFRMARHQRLADKYFTEGNLPKAEVEYLIALRLDSNNPHTMTRLADIYFQQGRFRRAYAFEGKPAFHQ
jgi:Tfp pilus assembly protein PilF